MVGKTRKDKDDELDEYLREVVQRGDEGSALLAAKCAPTLRNLENITILREGMNGISVLNPMEEHRFIVHSVGGDPDEKNIERYASSLVERLVHQAKSIGAKPLAFADVIDARDGTRDLVDAMADPMISAANSLKLAIMNGEFAILGDRVTCEANICGTMISAMPVSRKARSDGKSYASKKDGIAFAVFDPEGKFVYINADGIGTKPEFYERLKNYKFALGDSAAMKVDDFIKIGATGKVVSDVVETRGAIPFQDIESHAHALGRKMGLQYIVQHEDVGNRIRGYNDHAPALNISGCAVSVIDEQRLKNMLKPSAGEYLIAIRGISNPRSNGITDKRKLMVKLFGQDYHKNDIGKLFLQYLAEPSTILYPVFKELVDKGLATSVYHMSGGAYKGKLAKPLAKHDLHVSIDGLFPPDWREVTLAGANFTSAETSYSKWPMGNDGFVTTTAPEEVIRIIRSHGMEAISVGKLDKAVNGVTGVHLKAFNGQDVYYSGKD